MSGRRAAKGDERERTVDEWYATALRYISRYACSTARLRGYLERKGCPSDLALTIVLDLDKKGYLNDIEYAKLLVDSLKDRYGPRRILTRLLSREISREIATDAVDRITEEEQLRAAQGVAERFLNRFSTATLESEEVRRSLIRHLLSRGFGYSIARAVVNEQAPYIHDPGEDKIPDEQ